LRNKEQSKTTKQVTQSNYLS